MNPHNSLLPKHGGYKHLLSYQLAELIFDVTVLFCEKYVPVSDRTNDQMVQSARSGFQNLAEGSVDSGVSKKSEIKLTGIAIGCLDELSKDYRKYLQKKNLEEWPFQHPALVDFKQRQVKTLETFREWVKNTWKASGKQVPSDQIAANGVLALLNLTLYLTRKQLAALEKKFLEDGGIAERMERLRKEAQTRNNMDTRTDTDKHGPTRTGRG